MTKQQLTNDLAKMGYRIDETNSFNYVNNMNGNSYPARSCYLVEVDTGLSFANIYARRDVKFQQLQNYRQSDPVINGRVFEL